MNSLIFLITLGCLAGFNLIILSFVYILDIVNVNSNQKIITIKTGLTMIWLLPIIFTSFRFIPEKTKEIVLPLKSVSHVLNQISNTTHVVQHVNWAHYLFISYIICVLLMLFKIILSYISARQLLASSFSATIQGNHVYLSENISSPLSFGFPTANIYLPANAEKKWTSREIEMCLAHENTHIKRKDPLWKLISLITRATLFFVPWSYLLHNKFELEMEIICDSTTCITTNANIIEYSNLLLSMVCIESHHLAFTNISNSTLKRRFVAMKIKQKHRPILMAALNMTLLLTGTAAIAMSSNISASKTTFNILSKIYVDNVLISSPRVIAQAEQKASIMMADIINTKNDNITASGNSIKLDLLANDLAGSGKDDLININYHIQYENGKQKMHSESEMTLTPNQENAIKLTEAGHTYEIRLLANRV